MLELWDKSYWTNLPWRPLLWISVSRAILAKHCVLMTLTTFKGSTIQVILLLILSYHITSIVRLIHLAILSIIYSNTPKIRKDRCTVVCMSPHPCQLYTNDNSSHRVHHHPRPLKFPFTNRHDDGNYYSITDRDEPVARAISRTKRI